MRVARVRKFHFDSSTTTFDDIGSDGVSHHGVCERHQESKAVLDFLASFNANGHRKHQHTVLSIVEHVVASNGNFTGVSVYYWVDDI